MTQRDVEQNTYRFLRLGLVGLGTFLIVSVGWQIGDDSGCYRSSISAYFHSPVQGVFVAALAAIGASLIVYQGSTPAEDVLLNLTGAAAFIVALVPTSEDTHHCVGSLVETRPKDLAASVQNNVAALLIAGAVAVATAYLVNRPAFDLSRWNRVEKTVLWLTLGVIVGGYLWLIVAADDLVDPVVRPDVHKYAAITLFVGLVGVVVASCFYQLDPGRRMTGGAAYFYLYAVLALLMLVITLVLICLRPGERWLFWLEGEVIAGFVAFWLIQSKALWNAP